MTKPRKKPKPGQGRKTEGRERRNVLMLPEAWQAAEAAKSGPGDSIGRVIERSLGISGARRAK